MFTINQGFDLNSPQFNFKRDYFANVADLKAAPETSFPDHFITNVAGVLYQLTKSNSVDATTGKWRKVQLGSDVDLSNYAQKSELNKYNQALKSISFNNGKGITGTSINNTIVSLGGINEATDSSDGLMSANDKAKLDGIAVGANKYVLPVASATTLGGIKLGSGLSATSDGTVSVSKDIVAGSVEWNNIKNKPNVAILGTGDADGTDANSGRILFQTEDNNDGYAIIGHDGDSYSVSVSGDAYDNSKTTYISSDGVSVSSTKKTGGDINKVEIHSNGITLSNIEGVPSNCVFMTDGTIQELTAISTEELNKIFV